jgi:hypothetical protein
VPLAPNARWPSASAGSIEGREPGDLLDGPDLTALRYHEHDHADGTAVFEAAFYRHLTIYEALLPHQLNGGVLVATGFTFLVHADRPSSWLGGSADSSAG